MLNSLFLPLIFKNSDSEPTAVRHKQNPFSGIKSLELKPYCLLGLKNFGEKFF